MLQQQSITKPSHCPNKSPELSTKTGFICLYQGEGLLLVPGVCFLLVRRVEITGGGERVVCSWLVEGTPGELWEDIVCFLMKLYMKC